MAYNPTMAPINRRIKLAPVRTNHAGAGGTGSRCLTGRNINLCAQFSGMKTVACCSKGENIITCYFPD